MLSNVSSCSRRDAAMMLRPCVPFEKAAQQTRRGGSSARTPSAVTVSRISRCSTALSTPSMSFDRYRKRCTTQARRCRKPAVGKHAEGSCWSGETVHRCNQRQQANRNVSLRLHMPSCLTFCARSSLKSCFISSSAGGVAVATMVVGGCTQMYVESSIPCSNEITGTWVCVHNQR